jgi:ATP-dependent DNA helicase RecQ
MMQELDAETADRQKRKVRHMLRLVERDECRHRAIVGHFGETIENCGNSCDRCLGIDRIEEARNRRRTSPRRGVSTGLAPDAEPRFLGLRALRKTLAAERGIPAYLVFNDATLQAMATENPDTATALAAITGVGPKKLAEYGEAFLQELQQLNNPESP